MLRAGWPRNGTLYFSKRQYGVVQLGHAKKLMEPEDTGHKEPFKLSKFKHVKSKMGSLPGTRKPASQVVQAAPDVLDVEAEGAA